MVEEIFIATLWIIGLTVLAVAVVRSLREKSPNKTETDSYDDKEIYW